MSGNTNHNVTAILEQANTLAEQKQWTEAADACKQALEGTSGNIRVLGELGWYLSRAKRYIEAIDVYTELIRLEPSNAKWPYMLGYQYYDQQKYETAVRYFDQALTIDPDYIKVLYRKGYALSQVEGKKGNALTTFERCRTVYRNLEDAEARERELKYYTNACYQQGKLLLQMGKHWQAQARLVEAANLKPDDAEIHYSLGKCYLESEKYDKAISSLEEARSLSTRPEHYVLDKLAQAYLGAKQPSQALQIYEQMPLFLRKPYILRNLGCAYMKLDRWEEAEQTLEDAVKRERSNHNGHYFLGLAYQQNGKYRKAATAYQKAIDLRQKRYNLAFPDAGTALSSLPKEHPELAVVVDNTAQAPPQPSSPSRCVGRIEKYFDNRGFGFVATEGSSKGLFFHISEVSGRDTVTEGEYLEYQINQGEKGLAAIDCRVVSSSTIKATR